MSRQQTTRPPKVPRRDSHTESDDDVQIIDDLEPRYRIIHQSKPSNLDASKAKPHSTKRDSGIDFREDKASHSSMNWNQPSSLGFQMNSPRKRSSNFPGSIQHDHNVDELPSAAFLEYRKHVSKGIPVVSTRPFDPNHYHPPPANPVNCHTSTSTTTRLPTLKRVSPSSLQDPAVTMPPEFQHRIAALRIDHHEQNNSDGDINSHVPRARTRTDFGMKFREQPDSDDSNSSSKSHGPTRPPIPGPLKVRPPTPGPLITRSPSPGPLMTRSPTPGPLMTRSPTPGPLMTRSPTPGPLMTRSPTPGPLMTRSPTPGPLMNRSPTPGPLMTRSPTPGPFMTRSPTPGPASYESSATSSSNSPLGNARSRSRIPSESSSTSSSNSPQRKARSRKRVILTSARSSSDSPCVTTRSQKRSMQFKSAATSGNNTPQVKTATQKRSATADMSSTSSNNSHEPHSTTRSVPRLAPHKSSATSSKNSCQPRDTTRSVVSPESSDSNGKNSNEAYITSRTKSILSSKPSASNFRMNSYQSHANKYASSVASPVPSTAGMTLPGPSTSRGPSTFGSKQFKSDDGFSYAKRDATGRKQNFRKIKKEIKSEDEDSDEDPQIIFDKNADVPKPEVTEDHNDNNDVQIIISEIKTVTEKTVFVCCRCLESYEVTRTTVTVTNTGGCCQCQGSHGTCPPSV